MVGKRFTRRGDAPDDKYPMGIDDNGVSLTYKDCLFLLNNYYEGYCGLQKRYHELLNENQHLRHVIVELDSLDWDIQWLKNNIKDKGIECAKGMKLCGQLNDDDLMINELNGEVELLSSFIGEKGLSDDFDKWLAKRFKEKLE